MTHDDDELDDAWDKIGGPAPEGETADADDADGGAATGRIEVPPPLVCTFVIRADKVPVAPWAQGWRVGAIGPEDGHVTLVCQHEIEVSPVAQLSAVTGILSSLKQAHMKIEWWAIQARGPLQPEQEPDLDDELRELLGPKE